MCLRKSVNLISELIMELRCFSHELINDFHRELHHLKRD